MLPPMNEYSIAATTTSRPSSRPVAMMTASLMPVRLDRRPQPVAVRLGVGELQRIVRGEVREVLGPFAVEQRAQPLGGADPEMVRALRADVQVVLEILVVEDLRAVGTLDPEPFGHPAGLLGRGRRHRLPGLLEPGHRDTLPQVKSQKSKVQSRWKPRPGHATDWSAARSTACPGSSIWIWRIRSSTAASLVARSSCDVSTTSSGVAE